MLSSALICHRSSCNWRGDKHVNQTLKATRGDTTQIDNMRFNRSAGIFRCLSDLTTPGLTLKLKSLGAIHQIMEIRPTNCTLSESIRRHVTRVKPNEASENFLVKQITKELHMAKQGLFGRDFDKSRGSGTVYGHSVHIQGHRDEASLLSKASGIGRFKLSFLGLVKNLGNKHALVNRISSRKQLGGKSRSGDMSLGTASPVKNMGGAVLGKASFFAAFSSKEQGSPHAETIFFFLLKRGIRDDAKVSATWFA